MLHRPAILEHGRDDRDKIFRRLQLCEHGGELFLDFLTGDRLAKSVTALLATKVIGVLFTLALRPSSRKRRIAGRAAHSTAQREIIADIFASGCVDPVIQLFLNALECREADQAIMLSLTDGHTPRPAINQTGVEMAAQEMHDRLLRDGVVLALLRELRVILEEAHHFRLRAKAPACIPFESLLDD
ncbi:MAG: hypothetical protein AAFW83_09070 [Pseudomonadota bacterium]